MTYCSEERAKSPHHTLIQGVLASLLLHVLILTGFKVKPPEFKGNVIRVSLVDMKKPTQKKHQIVSPSEAPEVLPDPATKKFSERDSRVVVEKIRRGEQVAKPPPSTKNSSKVKRLTKTKAKSTLKRKKPFSKQLEHPNSNFIDKLTSLAQIEKKKTLEDSKKTAGLAEQSSQQTALEEARKSLSLGNYTPFSNTHRSLDLTSRLGVSDYLPEIDDGDITLLNAKANRHATFVRRVALQVFGAVKRLIWHGITRNEIAKITSFAIIEAIMSKEGKLLSVEVLDSSGSRSFDNIINEAANEGCWDQNPPAGAPSVDGKIHFVFQSRTWSHGSRDSGVERRWLLLGTGLL